jgi:hypothetical protein
MTRAVVAAVGLVAAALAALLLVEFRALAPQEPALALRARRGAVVVPPVADARPGDLTPAHVATVLARPLFRPDRRPPALPDAAVGKAANLPRLTGIMIDGGGRRAIFADERKPIVAVEGDRIGVYLVQAIAPGEVTVYGPEGQRVLRPAFDQKAGDPKAGDAPQAATPQPGLAPGVGVPAPPRPPGASILDMLLSRGVPAAGVPGLPASPEAPVPPPLPPPQGTAPR